MSGWSWKTARKTINWEDFWGGAAFASLFWILVLGFFLMKMVSN